MNDLVADITAVLVWTVNGFLVLVYYAVDHIQTVLLAISVLVFAVYISREQMVWAIGSGALAITASLLAPAPVPLFLLVMSLAGWAGQWLEQYNKPANHWNTIRGQALYAIAGLGFALYRNFGLGASIANDPMMSQGAGYLNALIGIGMYVIPLGWLAMLTQSIWAHPPAQGTPDRLITNIRTRGKR
ncbi:hypothetical protein ANAEL_00331 [Anaerolineales bacterium]|nr:hypothetical protein ANAEL_00331 [Anaerolineales bacterium]